MHASTFHQDFVQFNFQQGACAPQAPPVNHLWIQARFLEGVLNLAWLNKTV